MFSWYSKATYCYTYLHEIPATRDSETSDDVLESDLSTSNDSVFTRGWCLGELLAPSRVQFFGTSWNYLGTKENASLQRQTVQIPITNRNRLVSKNTGIPLEAIDGRRDLDDFSVAQRMSWAAARRTARIEDRAYSLLGIFDISMALLYGEGNRAFRRLQEEIARQHLDHTLLVWDGMSCGQTWTNNILAPTPECFRNSGRVTNIGAQKHPFVFATPGLQTALPCLGARLPNGPEGRYYALLDARLEDDITKILALPIKYISGTNGEMRIDAQYTFRPWEMLLSRSFRPEEVIWFDVVLMEKQPTYKQSVLGQPFSYNERVTYWLCPEPKASAELPTIKLDQFESPSDWKNPAGSLTSALHPTGYQCTDPVTISLNASERFSEEIRTGEQGEVDATFCVSWEDVGTKIVIVTVQSTWDERDWNDWYITLRDCKDDGHTTLEQGGSWEVEQVSPSPMKSFGQYNLVIRMVQEYIVFEPARMIYVGLERSLQS